MEYIVNCMCSYVVNSYRVGNNKVLLTKFLVSQCLFNDIIGRVLSVVCEGRRSLGGLEVVRGMVCSGSGG